MKPWQDAPNICPRACEVLTVKEKFGTNFLGCLTWDAHFLNDRQQQLKEMDDKFSHQRFLII